MKFAPGSVYNQNHDLKSITTYSKLIFILLLSPILFLSCSDDNDDEPVCFDEVRTENVTSVDAPESGLVNETIDIEVEFNVSNGCGEFNRFLETGTEASRGIEVEAVYEGCNCTQLIETKTVSYEFEADEPGEYELNFKSGPSEFITVNLEITEEADEAE